MMRRVLCMVVAGVACGCMLLSGCAQQGTSLLSSPTEIIEPEPSAAQIVVDTPNPLDLPAESVLSDEDVAAYGIDACFGASEIPEKVFARMSGKTFKSGGSVSRDDLRYVRVLHVNAEGETLTGEIVVNSAIAEEVCEIFRELYDAQYPIERMRLADDYDADDIASMEDNNTSGFNDRPIEGTNRPSKHSLGMAVDINTFYNPYYRLSDGVVSPEASASYLDRSKSFPYKIAQGDLCYQLFTERGYTWGGHWNSVKDYQHFEK